MPSSGDATPRTVGWMAQRVAEIEAQLKKEREEADEQPRSAAG